MSPTSEGDGGRAPSAMGGETAAGRIRLLAVDDEPAVLRSLKALFRGGAYELSLAESAEEALALLSDRPIDVIISDMHMPVMNGMELLREVRSRFPEPMRIVLSGDAEGDRVISVLNAAGIFAYVSKPWDGADLKLKVHRAAEQLRLRQLLDHQADQLERLNSSLEDRVRERTAELGATTRRLEQTLDELEESYGSVVRMLADIAELRLPALRGQSQQVARDSRRLAQMLGLSSRQVRDIETAALLRDIGLVVMPDEILALGPESMTEEQRARFQRHPILGEIALMAIPAMRQAARIVRSQGELYAGHGFPDGLAGEAIPLGARIIALVKDYHVLLEAEPRGESLTEEAACSRLRCQSGNRYDPQLIDLLERLGREPPDPRIQVDEVQLLDTKQLQPGMVLYEGLRSTHGALLMRAGQRLSADVIDTIRELEGVEGSRYLIYVQDSSDTGEPPS